MHQSEILYIFTWNHFIKIFLQREKVLFSKLGGKIKIIAPKIQFKIRVLGRKFGSERVKVAFFRYFLHEVVTLAYGRLNDSSYLGYLS